MKYFFILGREPKLSLAELNAVLKNKKLLHATDRFAIFDLQIPRHARDDTAIELIEKLGGTVKIGEIVETQDPIALLPKTNKKIIFGINDYTGKLNVLDISKKIKKELNQSARFVSVKKGEFISSVVADKNKLLSKTGCEINIFPNTMGRTLAVQPFEKLSHLDYGRPARDDRSGMLPPKLATMMINLARAKLDSKLLDPFCGSGTIIQQALLLGYKNVIGTDVSEKAIANTKQNLEWLQKQSKKKFDYTIFQHDARKLSEKIKPNSIDTIITEPFLGKPLTGRETLDFIEKQVQELTKFYFEIFVELAKAIKKSGTIIIIVPSFKFRDSILTIDIKKILPPELKIQNSWQYARPNAHVIRNIYKLTK